MLKPRYQIETLEELPAVESKDLEIDGRFIEGFQAIWNPETGHVFDVPSSEYKLYPHLKAITDVEEILAMHPELGQWNRAVWLDGEGERMRCTYTFIDHPVEFQDPHRAKGELLNPTIDIFNSYDRSWKYQLLIGAHRLVCTNGMTVGETYGRFKKRHVQSFSPDEALELCRTGILKVREQIPQWQDWATEQLLPAEVEKTVDKLKLGAKEKELLLEEQETSTGLSIEDWLLFVELDMRKEQQELMTRWILFNILTQFITHQVTKELRRQQLEQSVNRLFYTKSNK